MNSYIDTESSGVNEQSENYSTPSNINNEIGEDIMNHPLDSHETSMREEYEYESEREPEEDLKDTIKYIAGEPIDYNLPVGILLLMAVIVAFIKYKPFSKQDIVQKKKEKKDIFIEFIVITSTTSIVGILTYLLFFN